MIQLVSGEYPPDVGGLGDYTARLRRALAELECETHVVSRRDVGRWNASALAWLVRHAPERGVVHVQYQAAAYDLLGDICLLPLVLHRVRPGVKVLTTFHDARVPYLFPRAGPLRGVAVRLLARTSDAVIAADQRDLRQLRVRRARGFHVPIGPNVPCAPPDGYDRAAFRRSLGLGPADLAVAYFGLLNVSKGLDRLLSTFERVRSERPTAKLLLLGGQVGASDVTDRRTAHSVAARIAALGEAAVQTGWLAERELSAYLLAGDVALLPYVDGASARRGSLLACAEHGLPIVSTRPAGIEVAEAISVVESDPDALASAVLAAAEESTALRAASRALAERVSWSRIAADHLAIYDRVLYSRP